MHPENIHTAFITHYIGHANRTRFLMVQLLEVLRLNDALEVSFTPDEERNILCAAFHHDIGKLILPLQLLQKPCKLEPSEFEIIKQHTKFGAKLAEQHLTISRLGLSVVQDVCRHHHERFDGSGYPDRLRGKEIPYPARLMAVVDVYDALTHQRPYKPAYSPATARGLLAAGSGTQFDPAIAAMFLKHVPTEKPHCKTVIQRIAST